MKLSATSWTRRAATAVALLTAAGLLVTGCSSGSVLPDEASSPQANDQADSAPDSADQAEPEPDAADQGDSPADSPIQAFADCMSQAGIDMQRMETDSGGVGVWSKDIALGGWSGPGDDSFQIISDEDRPIDEITPVIEMAKAAAEQHPESWMLVTDSQDLSEPFDACVNQTGYTEPSFVRNPANQ
ncbi:MAG: hypothetical protein FWG16_04620 [Micrococcales bacterium]|nr:hypothetical protein [Micrococcales bacterium]